MGWDDITIMLLLRPPHDGYDMNAEMRKVVSRLAFNGKRAILDTNWV
jgi:hypothetical protein